MVRANVPEGEWILYVDADEFVESPENLKSVVLQAESDARDVVYGWMIDRFADNREPLPIDDDDDLFDKFPHVDNYTKKALRAWIHKSCLMKYRGERPLVSCHDYGGQVWDEYRKTDAPMLNIWHFKWIDGTRGKLVHKVGSFKHQGLGWWTESVTSLKDIYGVDTDIPPAPPAPESPNPHNNLGARSHWVSAAADESTSDLWQPKWPLEPQHAVMTLGTSFSQHLGPALRARGYDWLYSAPQLPISSPAEFSQWVAWALEDDAPPEEFWLGPDHAIDPFHPSIESRAFDSPVELMSARQRTIQTLKDALPHADVLVLTLAATECWVHDPGGWVYATCPGLGGGAFDSKHHRFVNLTTAEVRNHLLESIERIRGMRTGLKVLLSVSPEPLAVTASGHHVLSANAASKATLRAVAGELAAELDEVDYFPAHEVEQDQGSPFSMEDSRAIDLFFSSHGIEAPPHPGIPGDSEARVTERRSEAWRPMKVGRVDGHDGDELVIRLGELGGVRLNPTAARIWERCDGARTEADILNELSRMYEIPADTMQADLRATLSVLIDAGAVEPERTPWRNPLTGARYNPRIHLGLVSETSDAFLNQVKLCLFSLRRNGGALAGIPVTLMTNGRPLSDQEAAFFKTHFSPIEFRTAPRLGAIPHTSKLNVFYSVDPSAYDVLLYMDCDTVVRRPLDQIADPIIDQGAQFICRRGGKTDRGNFVDFDDLVRRYCGEGLTNKVFHEGQKEWPMFNSGVFLATSDAVRSIRANAVDFTYRLFNEWQRINALERLPEDIRNQIEFRQLVRVSWPIEQGALALACIHAGINVQYLSEAYNSWGGGPDFHVLHCFKSLYQFDRATMFSDDAREWIADYLDSDIPGKVFLASEMLEYQRDMLRGG